MASSQYSAHTNGGQNSWHPKTEETAQKLRQVKLDVKPADVIK